MEQLIKLAHLLNSNNINWAVGGSTLLKLRGIEIMAHDIDIMIHESDFEMACELLKHMCCECETKESNVFRTKFYRKFNWDGMEIDCMSGMCINLMDMEFNYPFDHKDYDILYRDTPIPLCYIEDWYVLYNLMPNREDKVKYIEAYLKENTINKLRFEYLHSLNIPLEIKRSIEILNQ